MVQEHATYGPAFLTDMGGNFRDFLETLEYLDDDDIPGCIDIFSQRLDRIEGP